MTLRLEGVLFVLTSILSIYINSVNCLLDNAKNSATKNKLAGGKALVKHHLRRHDSLQHRDLHYIPLEEIDTCDRNKCKSPNCKNTLTYAQDTNSTSFYLYSHELFGNTTYNWVQLTNWPNGSQTVHINWGATFVTEIKDEEDQISPYPCENGYHGKFMYVDTFRSNSGMHHDPNSKGHYYTCCREDDEPPQCSMEVCQDSIGANCIDTGIMGDNPLCPSSSQYQYARAITFGESYHGESGPKAFTCCDKYDGSMEYSEYVHDVFAVILSFIAFVCSLSLLAGMLFSSKCREHAWYWYIIGLAIPDLLYNLVIMIGVGFGITGRKFALGLREAIYVFNFHSNIWLNVLIAIRIFQLLLSSKQCRRINPMKPRQAIIEVIVLYVLVSILAVTFGVLWEKSRYVTEEDARDTFVFATKINIAQLTSFSVTMGIALFVLSYIMLRVYFGKLLPINGRTRVLALYFFRIIGSFFLCWVPTFGFIMYAFKSFRDITARSFHIETYLISIQGMATFVVALTNKDVKKAVIENVISRVFPCTRSCSCYEEDDRGNISEKRQSVISTKRLSSMAYGSTKRSSIQSTGSTRSKRKTTFSHSQQTKETSWKDLKAAGVKTFQKSLLRTSDQMTSSNYSRHAFQEEVVEESEELIHDEKPIVNFPLIQVQSEIVKNEEDRNQAINENMKNVSTDNDVDMNQVA